MKNLLYGLSLVFLIGCNDDEDILMDTQNELVGNWVWTKSTGGIKGDVITPATSKTNIKLVITDKSLKVYENGEFSSENLYNIENKTSIHGGTKQQLIFSNNKTAQNYQISGNKLYLNDECYDCFSYEYVKE